jgi:hypothetical protein
VKHERRIGGKRLVLVLLVAWGLVFAVLGVLALVALQTARG